MSRMETEVPPRMRRLDRDKRGYPIPWIVQRDLDGRPFFTINDSLKVMACGDRKLCGICGRPLERDVWLVGGPGSAFHEHGAFLDPPMHHACARYAMRVCPYIGARYPGRIDNALAKHGRWPPGLGIVQEDLALPEQPPFFVLARTLRAPLDLTAGSIRFNPHRPWRSVEFWRHGVQLTDTEARDLLTASETWPWTPADLIHWPHHNQERPFA